MEHTRKSIFWIGGSKGGVGKSMVTMAVVDYLQDKGEDVLLVDCDTSNPDASKAYRAHTDTALLNLDEVDGWIELLNVAHDHPGRTLVVNTAARNNTAVMQFGETLNSSIEELRRPLVSLWVINRQRDSLELLKQFMKVIPNATVHVVRNAYFGDEKKFELYNGSPLREVVESRGGKSITFPDLADRVTDDLYSKRLSLAAAAKTLPLGNRAELARWRREVKRALVEVVA